MPINIYLQLIKIFLNFANYCFKQELALLLCFLANIRTTNNTGIAESLLLKLISLWITLGNR